MASSNATPYQGDRRTFGLFKCSCGYEWQSFHTWANKWQSCRSCSVKVVFPYKQLPLSISEVSEVDRIPGKHPPNKCQVCMELGGRFCGTFDNKYELKIGRLATIQANNYDASDFLIKNITTFQRQSSKYDKDMDSFGYDPYDYDDGDDYDYEGGTDSD